VARSRSSLVLIVGLVLVALGAANAVTGWSKVGEYRAKMKAAVAAGGETVARPFTGTASILEPPTDAQLVYETASLKHEYYLVVRRGGLFLLMVGGALVAAVVLRAALQRPDSSAAEQL
jgi:hypothetical protein